MNRLPGGERLETWKEIAAHLDHDVRTVQRWEDEEGLPVHRRVGKQRGTVYAFTTELDAWLAERLQNENALPTSGRKEAAPSLDRHIRTVRNSHGWRRNQQPDSAGEPPSSGPDTQRTWRATLAGAIVVAAVAASGWYLASSSHSSSASLSFAPLTTYPGPEVHPALSPDGGQVAYVWSGENEDNFDIYVEYVSSGRPRRLTTHPDTDHSPAWSPDGRSIAFLRMMSSNEAAVVITDPQGGRERKVAEIDVRDSPLQGHASPYVDWTKDGESLVVSDRPGATGPWALFRISVKTGQKQRLTRPPDDLRPGDTGVAMSPEGGRLAFARSGRDWEKAELYLLRLDAELLPLGEPQQLTFGGQTAKNPAWTADGKTIVYAYGQRDKVSLWRIEPGKAAKPVPMPLVGEAAAQPTLSGRSGLLAYERKKQQSNIWRLELSEDGRPAGQAEEFIASSMNDVMPQFSPDGTQIAFASDRSGHYEIWICEADGSDPRQLTDLQRTWTLDPRWSPDGAKLLFGSRSGGFRAVHVIGLEDRMPRPLIDGPIDNGNGRWSRDGSWVYFSSKRREWTQIWRQPSSGGEAIAATEDNGNDSAESPDGAFLYYLKGGWIDAALWRVPTNGGRPEEVLPSVATRCWAVVEDGIYFIPHVKLGEPRYLKFLRFATGEAERIVPIEKPPDGGLTASPDRRWVAWAQMDHKIHDLVLVENFR